MTKRKSKPTEEYDEPSETELYQRMMFMPEPHRSYAALMYLFGNRVSEGIPGRSRFISRNTGELNQREYPGIRKKDIQEQEGWIEISQMPTLKRKVKDATKFYREGILFIYGPGEMPFVKILQDYINSKDDYEILWKKTRKSIWYNCNKYLKIPPKKLRGMRAKKDAKKYGLGALELKEKYNWGDTDMPFHYAKFNKESLKNKMERIAQYSRIS